MHSSSTNPVAAAIAWAFQNDSMESTLANILFGIAGIAFLLGMFVLLERRKQKRLEKTQREN